MRARYLLPLVAALAVAAPGFTPVPAIAAPDVSNGASADDRVVTTDGDMTGLHVLVADRDDGYAWRTAATLSEPATETDMWIGQACVTGSGRRAVVVYAPREFTNHAELFARGALAAVVDLDTGSVTKLPEPVNLAYYNPGCGAGETAVLTEELDGVGGRVTRLITVDTATGEITSTVDVPGQVTSAVPTPDGPVAASGTRLVRVDGSGSLTTLVRTEDVPFRLAVADDGAVGYEIQRGDRVAVHRYADGRDRVVLTAQARSVRLAGVAGHLYVRGAGADRFTGLPDGWRGVDTPVDAELSTTGALAVTSAVNARETVGGTTLGGTPTGIMDVHITQVDLSTDRIRAGTVVPVSADPARGGAPSPAASRVPGLAGGGLAPNGTGDQTTDPDRACAIPRNDPRIMSVQPTPQMAEWAADRAVMGTLNTVSRPTGFNGSDLPAYFIQQMFPSHELRGGGHVPAQVLLGVMAQESNMWQASPHAVDGESGNFEQGGFYGRAGIDTVDFANADCGYGATQVTTGMEVGDTVYTHNQQVALTVDYASNIAAGLQILQDKWNQMWDLGVIANNGDPQYLENWWFALWAYNTGWHYTNDPDDPFSRPDAWGLGWSNNVRNTDYPFDRDGFLTNITACDDDEKDPDGNCIDAKHPNDWSYPERVMGFAKHSLTRFDYQSGTFDSTFTPADWTLEPYTPPLETFCSPDVNDCDPSVSAGTHACTRADFTCFWHASVTWIPEMNLAGTEVVTYDETSPEPVGFRFYESECSMAGLPDRAWIIDDQPNASTRNGCDRDWIQHGGLTFEFAEDSAGHYPSKIDFHQLDTGFNGHFWFAHGWTDTVSNALHEVTGTWTLNQTLNQWARVWVYVPDHGAADPQAFYTVHGSDSSSPSRSVVEGSYLDDNRDPGPGHWESLGAFHFAGTTPSVSLSNMTGAVVNAGFADGDRDVAWDAVAFEPLLRGPANQVVVLGDSYASGEGASGGPVDGHWDYYRSSDHDGSGPDDDLRFRDACHRSPYAWSRAARLPDDPSHSVAHRLAEHDPALTYHMTACSGAVADNLLAGHLGQYDEGSQLDQGYLDQHTSLVMLSIGGNDARFGDVIKKCITTIPTEDCPDTTLDGDSAPLRSTEPAVIDNQVGPAVQSAIAAVHELAPNAKIMLMGYPRIFERLAPCVPGISSEEQFWLAKTADELNARLDQAVTNQRATGVDVTFADPRAAFTGRSVCGTPSEGIAPEIRGITLQITRGEDPMLRVWGSDLGIVSAQSFHPDINGAETYASVATETLVTMYGP